MDTDTGAEGKGADARRRERGRGDCAGEPTTAGSCAELESSAPRTQVALLAAVTWITANIGVRGRGVFQISGGNVGGPMMKS